MQQKRTVFLFGSGATLAWGSPPTSELTELIRESGFKTTDNKTPISEFIYTTLLDNGYSSNDVNFETIISVIEELIVYYSQFNSDTKTPSLVSRFFCPRYHEAQLLNYPIKGGILKHGYQLELPAGGLSKPAYHNETPSQLYFQTLLSRLLEDISAKIDTYAHHTAGSSMQNVDSETSKSFVSWMKLRSAKGILRLYTLNYERIFKILLSRAGLALFEGFDCGEYIGNDRLRANVCRILSDTTSHIHYNLHGSAFWEVRDLDKKQLPNPEIVLSPFAPSASGFNGLASVQIEKGKTLLVTNIVTGYQKAQRAMISPLKQMQAAFDRDCCFADDLYVVGYSFGDEHINESIKTAIRHNKNLKITIVDPQFIKNEMDRQLARPLFSFRQDGNINKRRVVPDRLYTYFDGAISVHTIPFEEFLESQ